MRNCQHLLFEHPVRRWPIVLIAAGLSITTIALAPALSADTWRGPDAAPEDRCSVPALRQETRHRAAPRRRVRPVHRHLLRIHA